MDIINVTPQYGINYRIGYVGFTFASRSFVSNGIAFFTRWDRKSAPVSHTFIVSGPNECIEAQGVGVVVSDLEKYFKDLRYLVAFKEPVGWTPELGERIVEAARKRVGKKYGYSLIVADALTHTAFGRMLGKLTKGWTTRKVTQLLDSKNQEICSELVANALVEQPELADAPLLKRLIPSEITPQMLFEDAHLFKKWKELESVK